jgi:branched-subunit amino acid transport protein
VNRVWATVVFAGLGTYAMRAVFLAFAHRMADVPPGVQRILRQIPPAALAAITLPALVRPHGELDLWQSRRLAGAVAAAVAWKTRSAALTLVVGIAVVMVLDRV